MAEKHYLFQKSTGEWVFGPTANSIMPAGLLRLAEVSETNINLRWVHNRDIAYRYGELAYGDFLQENGTAYASLAAFLAAAKGFFAAPNANIDELKNKMFPSKGIHVLTGTSAATTGTYSGFLVTEEAAISAIAGVDTDKVTGTNNFSGITLSVGTFIEIPGGFTSITLSAGSMILVKS